MISYPLLDLHHIHGGVRVFRKGESTEQYPHTGASLAPNGINQKFGFVSTEGYPHPEASSTVHMGLTGNRKGENWQAVSGDLILLSIQNPENQNFIIPVKNGSYLHFSKSWLHYYRIFYPIKNHTYSG